MLGDEPAPEERAQRVAEEDDGNARLLGGDQPVEGPEVADDLVPPALVGEMAEIGGGRPWSVAAMIVGVDCVARGIERGGETGVAAAVLGEAMGDLQNRARRTFRSQRRARRVWPSSARNSNSLPGIAASPVLSSPWSRQRIGISLLFASRVKAAGDREILLAESVAIL